MVSVPASPVGARARLPGRNPPPCGSCKGVFRPCPPAPLLVAGGTLIFLNILPTLLSVFDFRTGSAIRGEELLGQKSRKTIAFLVLRLNAPLRWSPCPDPHLFAPNWWPLRWSWIWEAFASVRSAFSYRTKKAGFSPWRRKSNLLTQTNAHFRDTYLKPVSRCIVSQAARLVKCVAT